MLRLLVIPWVLGIDDSGPDRMRWRRVEPKFGRHGDGFPGLVNCTTYNGYTAALAEATIDCIGTIGPDSFGVDAIRALGSQIFRPARCQVTSIRCFGSIVS